MSGGERMVGGERGGGRGFTGEGREVDGGGKRFIRGGDVTIIN